MGRLADLTRLFGQREIHILALNTLDTTDGFLRVIVDDPDRARELLRDNGVSFSESQVLAVEIAEHDVERVLTTLLETEVNIDYIYSFISRPMGRSALAMSIEDMDIAMDILGARNHKVLSQRDISR